MIGTVHSFGKCTLAAAVALALASRAQGGDGLPACVAGLEPVYAGARAAGERPWLADVDGDGRLDAVTLDSANVIRTYFGSAAGMAPPVWTQGPAYSFLEGVTDLDGDGKLDLVVATANHWNCSSNSLRIYWNSGSASAPFSDSAVSQLPMPPSAFCVHSEVIDFDGNGTRDLILTSMPYATWSQYPSRTYRNLGGRQFAVQSDFVWPRDLEQRGTEDYDGDGKADFLVLRKHGWADSLWGTYFYRGNGNGTFQAPIVNFASQRTVGGVAFRTGSPSGPRGGFAVYVGTAYSQALQLARWTGSSLEFAPLPVPAPYIARQAVDFDADGRDEMVLMGAEGTGLLGAMRIPAFGSQPEGVVQMASLPGFDFVFLAKAPGSAGEILAAAVSASSMVFLRSDCVRCLADLNADRTVDGSDLGQLLASWGPCAAGTCASDINADAVVDGADLGVLLNVWGTCQ